MVITTGDTTMSEHAIYYENTEYNDFCDDEGLLGYNPEQAPDGCNS